MNWVVLQAYGQKEIFLEARFLLVSAYPQLMANADCKVAIYTDSPDEVGGWGFPKDKVFTRLLSTDTIVAWKGKQDFVHRLKVEMLRDAAQYYQPGKMLYLDSDMVLRGSLTNIWGRIRPGNAIMHENEGRLSDGANPIMRKMHRFVKGRVFQAGGRLIEVDRRTVMRNAGVIGLDKANFSLIEEVLDLTDAMYSQYPKHVIEQLAFSFVLGSRLEVNDSSPQFLHYWYAKELRGWLETFFQHHGAEPMDKQAAAAQTLGLEEAAASRLAWKNKPSWKRRLLKAFGNDWQLPPFPSSNQAS